VVRSTEMLGLAKEFYSLAVVALALRRKKFIIFAKCERSEHWRRLWDWSFCLSLCVCICLCTCLCGTISP